MKKLLLYILWGLPIVATTITSCDIEALETSPTTAVSGTSMFANATAALVPLNGIYRSMYTQDWSTTGNVQQCDGIKAYTMMADVMGEDFIMGAQGSGWYWFDCTYIVKPRFTQSSFRSYDLWKAYYTWVANANYIIAAEETMEGTPGDVNNVIGQAYAIRAYSYDMLARMYSRTYKGHETDPGVPLYTEPTAAGTEGKPRGTLQDVYTQVLADINKAVDLLKEASPQKDKSHINYATACILKARICMVMEDWQEALTAAEAAIAGNTPASAKDILGGFNNRTMPGVLWGAQVISDQADGWGTFFTHMDWTTEESMYAHTAPKKINKLLYEKMGPNDARRAWWLPNQQNPDPDGPSYAYIQKKFLFADVSQWLADMIWIRVEEAYLTAAEAACRMNNDVKARELLTTLMSYRDPDYQVTKSGQSLGALTTTETGSLLEEILFQRRIELWGEFGRIYDIKRLKQGFVRTTEMGWPTGALIAGTNTQNPETYAWVLTIPQAEFDGNESLNFETDQNPTGDTK